MGAGPARDRASRPVRALGSRLEPRIVNLIEDRLDEVAREHGVAIPWAVESGSRAWGFPSPDSDYDCRFFFVRPVEHYLDPWPRRDVIETPLDPVLDVNGWDLVKAVRLAERGNATVTEWLRSPIVYDGDERFGDAMLNVCESLADPARTGRHYLHVGRDQWQRSGAAHGGDVALKKVFYAIRPAACLLWMRVRGSASPPMNLQELFAEAPPPGDVVRSVERLVEAKSQTRELGRGPVDPAVARWVEHEFALAETAWERDLTPRADAKAVAGQAFRDLLRRWAPR